MKQWAEEQVKHTLNPSGRITFYIAIEILAQIEKYSFTIVQNFRKISPTVHFGESFLPAAGKEFGG
jgi:hypothetical protein